MWSMTIFDSSFMFMNNLTLASRLRGCPGGAGSGYYFKVQRNVHVPTCASIDNANTFSPESHFLQP